MRELGLVIGYGRMGHIHAAAYHECDVRWMDANKENWRELLDKHDPQYVSVCSYDDAHFEQTMAAVDAGAAVLVEKPICTTEEQLTRLTRTGNSHIYCNLPLASVRLPPDGYLYELEYVWGRADQLTGWRAQCPGYSFTLGAGIHIVDVLLRNTGGRRVQTVSARGSNPAPFQNPTLIQATCTLEGGALATITINAASQGAHEHRFKVYSPTGLVDFRRWGSDKKTGLVHFINTLDGNLRQTADAMAVCFAIDRSIRDGNIQTVVYP